MKDKLITPDAYKQLEVERIEGALEARREIWYNMPVDSSVVEYLIMPLRELDAVAPEDRAEPLGVRPQAEPITVYINSYGGNAYEGMAGFDAIAKANAHVTTIGLGECISAGFCIFMGGDRRIANKNTVLMMHSVSMYNYGALPNIKDDVKHLSRVAQRKAEEFGARTNMSVDDWLEIIGPDGRNRDRYFTAEEAVELGIAHGIVGETQ